MRRVISMSFFAP